MEIKLRLFYPALINAIKSPQTVIVHGNTVGDCLRDYTRKYPEAEKWIFNSRGELFDHVLIHINSESIHRTSLTDTVKEHDELLLVVIIAGG